MSARIRLSQTQNTGLRQARRGRRGISLLEVMLAIAILGGSMAVIVQMVHTGSRAAIRARELTQAQIHAESVMSQIVSGVVLPQTASRSQLLIDSPTYPQFRCARRWPLHSASLVC